MRLLYIDVLKAIAIVAVVLYHSGILTFGYLGVDLFLVINGYLITKGLSRIILSKELSGGNLSLQEAYQVYFGFEISRVIRLLPVLLVAGIVCMVIGYYAMLPDDYENLSESVIATNLLSNNILAAITTKNYWDVVNEYKPLMHTWYVGIVMQFYLFYPILFFLARLDKKKTRRTLLMIISVLAIFSLFFFWLTTDAAARFYYLPSRFFEFAAGGIVALTWKPKELNRSIPSWIVYVCYALLLAFIFLNTEIIPSKTKLVAVVGVSVFLVMPSDVLENHITGNRIMAKIGAASYSIFVWHQIILAFYRYTISNEFTVLGYIVFLAIVALFSWLTYQYIEQRTKQWLDGKRSEIVFYVLSVSVFVCLTAFAGYIYMKGGVVRDVPELYISKTEKVDHNSYNDKIYKMDQPFVTNKQHWLIIGDSFGRDFANVILESRISEQVEVSYIFIDNKHKISQDDRFAKADRVFLSASGVEEDLVTEVEKVCENNNYPLEKLVIVGIKNFGESNGQFYAKRNSPDYFNQRTRMEKGFMERNAKLKSIYGERYLDLIELVIDEAGMVPMFTPDHHFISQDCRHFSKGGAILFSKMIDWTRYL